MLKSSPVFPSLALMWLLLALPLSSAVANGVPPATLINMDHINQAAEKSRKAILESALRGEKDASSASCAMLKILSIELIEMELMEANTLANLSTVMRDGHDEATVLGLATREIHLVQSSMDNLADHRSVCQNKLTEAAVNLAAVQFAKEISPEVTALDIALLSASARLEVKLKTPN